MRFESVLVFGGMISGFLRDVLYHEEIEQGFVNRKHRLNRGSSLQANLSRRL